MLEGYTVRRGTVSECSALLKAHHYLSREGSGSKGFKSGFNAVLVNPEGGVVGCCIFTGLPVPELLVGCFGLPRDEQEGFFELSRLCLAPEMQTHQKGVASWFVARALRLLRAENRVRAVLSYADADYHKGTVYRALNFGYYGLSTLKKDFYTKDAEGVLRKQSRGRTKGVEGVWLPRSRKHRFLMLYDKKLTVKWPKENAEKGA